MEENGKKILKIIQIPLKILAVKSDKDLKNYIQILQGDSLVNQAFRYQQIKLIKSQIKTPKIPPDRVNSG